MTVIKRNREWAIRPMLVACLTLAVFGGLLLATDTGFASGQEGRPRRTVAPVTVTSATPTPARPTVPVTTRASAPSPTPTPAPVQTPVSTGGQRPRLGDAPPPPKLKPKPTPTPPEEVDPDSLIKINTDLVNLNVRVIDRSNKPIDNVRQEDFHVYEDGVPQPIEYFGKQEVPIQYGLAVDTSLSLRNQLQSVIDAAKTIINSNKKGDETFIERFISSDKINVEKEFTDRKDELLDAVDNLYLEGGQTAVVDGVYLAAEHVAEYRKGDDSDRRRRALIVITDGEDRHSYYTEPQLFQRLREEDVQIYIIGFVNELDKDSGFIKKSPKDKAVNLINKMASDSGGRAFFPQSLSELPEIANAIVRDLRTQYVVSYNPTNKNHDGSYRAIRVAVDDGPNHDKRIALTRSGRTASPLAPPSSAKTPAKTGTTRPGSAQKTPNP